MPTYERQVAELERQLDRYRATTPPRDHLRDTQNRAYSLTDRIEDHLGDGQRKDDLLERCQQVKDYLGEVDQRLRDAESTTLVIQTALRLQASKIIC